MQNEMHLLEQLAKVEDLYSIGCCVAAGLDAYCNALALGAGLGHRTANLFDQLGKLLISSVRSATHAFLTLASISQSRCDT